MPHRGETIADHKAFNSAHHETTRGIVAEAQARGWQSTSTRHDQADGRSLHTFKTPDGSRVSVLHKGAERLTIIKAAGIPARDQHARNLKAVSAAMRSHKLLGTGMTHGGRTVHHYQSDHHDILVAHIGNECCTYTKPRTGASRHV